MSLGPSANPLHRSAGFRTSDIEDFRNAALTKFGATSVEVSGPDDFEAHGRFVELADVVVLSAASNSFVAVDYPEFDFARLSIPLAGRGATTIGNETIEIDEHQSCVTSPDRSTRVMCGGRHEWLNLRIKATVLRKKLTALLGGNSRADLQFAAALNLDLPRSRSLCQLVGFVAQQQHSAACELPPIALQELEQAIVTTFLFATRHTLSASLEREPGEGAPWQVRCVEDYIEAHWNEPVSIEAIVEMTGISTRSIFRAFQRSRGYSPMAFAKMVRLKHARRFLAAGDPNTSVTGVAFKCGFGNLGHFAQDYRKIFGELPSETLARTGRR